jgi:hypothetical protein
MITASTARRSLIDKLDPCFFGQIAGYLKAVLPQADGSY